MIFSVGRSLIIVITFVIFLESPSEKLQTSTWDEVIYYFVRGGKNRFFYLFHDPTSLYYDPYNLIQVKDNQQQHSIVPNSDGVHIISAYGIFRNISSNYTEFQSLVSWQRDATIFRGLKAISFFRMFVLLKLIRKWKNVTDRRRHNRIRLFLKENLIQQVF